MVVLSAYCGGESRRLRGDIAGIQSHLWGISEDKVNFKVKYAHTAVSRTSTIGYLASLTYD